MPTTITFRRGTSNPTAASGLTLGEPAFNPTLNTFFIGKGAGVTAAWVGAGICGASGGIAAGITYQVPTMAAVKDYVTNTTSGVASLNTLTGALTLVSGTNIGVTASGSSITVTNLGVQTFNGATGAVTGASLGANTFTGTQTFTAGLTTSYLYASTGSTFASTLQVNGGATFSGRVDVGGNIKVLGDTQLGDASTDSLTVFAGTTFNNRTDFAGNNNFATGLTSSGAINQTGNILFRGSTSKLIQTNAASLTITGTTTGVLTTGTNTIVFGVQTTDPLALYSATGLVNISTTEAGTNPSIPGIKILTDDANLVTGSVTLQPSGYLTAARTQTFQDASGIIALTSQLMGTVNGSTAATTAVTSFNGATGAVTGASLGANTFTGLNTFNAGITTAFIYASTGSTFGGTLKVLGGATFDGRVDVAGILDVAGGVTFESTSDHGGAARFASTIVSTGSVTANGGLTASTLDVSGSARTTGDVTVGATLTVNGNFFVSGTVTTVNRTDLNIDDKTITMGRTLASDALADGGGLVLKGTADRTWKWSQTRGWESSQGVNVASGSGYSVNGTSVLNATTLGSGVVSSSLTSVGTIGTGVWQGTVVGATYGGTGRSSYTIGDILYANGTSSLTILGASTAGRLLASTGAGAAPEYKQLLINDAGANSIATFSTGTGTLTATIQYATTAVKGVASFDSEMFTVTSGTATITRVDGGTY